MSSWPSFTLALLVLGACGSPPKAAAPTPAAAEHASRPEPGELDCQARVRVGNQVLLVVPEGKRKDASGRLFAKQETSPEAPIEVCGVDEQVQLLLDLRCNDGSNPFSSPDEAHASRLGNTGSTGRCSNVVDHYQAHCPEAAYDIYLDAYTCLVSELPADAKSYDTVVVEGLDLPLPVGWTLVEALPGTHEAWMVPDIHTDRDVVVAMWNLPHAEAQTAFAKGQATLGFGKTLPLPSAGAAPATTSLAKGTVALSYLHEEGGSSSLFLAMGQKGSPRLEQLRSILPTIAPLLRRNEHREKPYRELLLGDGPAPDLNVTVSDDKPKAAGPEDMGVIAEGYQGRTYFLPLGWEKRFAGTSVAAISSRDEDQLRYIYSYNSSQPEDTLNFFRSLMTPVVDGKIIARLSDEEQGRETIVFERDSSLMVISYAANEEGIHSFLLIAPPGRLSQQDYMLNEVLITATLTAGAEAAGGK